MTSVNDIWDSYEKTEAENLALVSGKLAILDGLISDYDKQDKEKAERLRWERAAGVFMLYISNNLMTLDKENNGFMEASKESFLKSIDVNRATDYFKQRVGSTANPFHKARLSYSIWTIKKDPNFLTIAVKSLMESAQVCFDANGWMECIHNIKTAYAISVTNNLHTLAEDVSGMSLELVHKFEDKREYRWIIELVEIVIHYSKRRKLDSKIIQNLLSVAERCADHYGAAANYHLCRAFLELVVQLGVILDDEKGKNGAIRKIAESFETEAKKRLTENAALASVVFYREAIKHYHRIGDSQKEKELMKKIGDSAKKIEWKKVSFDVSLPELQFKGDTPTAVYNEICDYNDPILVAGIDPDLPQPDLLDVVRTITFDDRYPISDSEKKDAKGVKVKRNRTWYIQLAEARFASAFKLLEGHKRIFATSLIDFLKDIGLFDGDSLKMLTAAVERHFAGDYISSIHILVPQVENALRSLLKLKGIPVEKTDAGAISVKDMGGILAEEEAKSILGRDFVTYLRLKFTDKEGMNIRNEVAHGLLKADKFDHKLSASLLYVLLKLGKLAVK